MTTGFLIRIIADHKSAKYNLHLISAIVGRMLFFSNFLSKVSIKMRSDVRHASS